MRKRKNKRKYSKPAVVLIIAVFCYVVYKFISLEITYQKLLSEKDKLTEELSNKKIYYEQLTSTLEQAKSDEYIEQLAKKYLGLINKDEKILIVKNNEKNNE